MVLRPEDIEQREFGSALRGFDKAEVRAFLRRVAGEVRYLESEVEAVRGGASAANDDRTVPELELPRVDTRPAPPALAPTLDDLPPRDLPVLGAAGSQLPEPVVAPPAALSASAPAEPEADRFGALGERIADLLRNAQETAEQVRHQADSDAAQTRAEAAAAGVELRTSADQYATQTREAAAAAADDLRASAEAYSTEVRSAADADAAAMRSSAEELLATAQAEAAEVREHALADANELRTRATEDLDLARSDAANTIAEAEAEAVTLRQRAIDEGVASLTGREDRVSRQEAEVAAEREQAMAELADARGQVSTLLQEARAQSEFIRQESEEIIRTKVRANMEQAQRRIDMLRTTETASKDRIAAARKELESALARLESEPAPGLPAGTEDLVLEEAQQAATGNDGLSTATRPDLAIDDPGHRFVDTDSSAGSVIDVDTVLDDDSAFDDSAFDDSAFDENAFDAGAAAADVFEEAAAADDGGDSVDRVIESLADRPEDDSSAFGRSEVEHEPLAVETELDMVGESTMVDLPSPEAVRPPPPPPPGFGSDDFVDPGVGQSVHGGSFFAPRGDESIPAPPPPPPGFETPIGIDAPVFESPVFESPVTDDTSDPTEIDPLEGLIPDEDEGAPVLEHEAEPADAQADLGSFPETAEPETVSDINTPENEDALAKLVREAMQRAVDSARGNQN